MNDQINNNFNLANNEIKAVNTLYGLIMGITADQIVSNEEIHFLNLWLKDNDVYTNTFPLNIVKRRINAILSDNIITAEEREDLYQALIKILGGNYQETGSASGNSTAFGTDDPDTILFSGSSFCLTGSFISGPRNICERAITKFGGIPTKTVTKNLNYLVIGSLASHDWVATSHGRKIEKALHYKENGSQITILTEETLTKHIRIF